MHEDDFVASVLRRTTGETVCRRAETLLCAYVDGELPGDDRELVEGHLAHCAPCRALAAALARAAEVLPALAVLDPGPAFTAAVLDLTSRRSPATAVERLVTWWHAWQARPRFAMELAYVATLVLVLVAGNPAPVLQAATVRTVTLAAEGIGRARETLPSALARVAPRLEVPADLKALAGAVRTASGAGQAAGQPDGVGGVLGKVMGQWTDLWTWVRGVAGRVFDGAGAAWAGTRQVVSSWLRHPTEPAPKNAR
jgi:hypothetical protein